MLCSLLMYECAATSLINVLKTQFGNIATARTNRLCVLLIVTYAQMSK